MDEQDYQKLLAYLKNLSNQSEEYKKWTVQFEERYNHIYWKERRVVPKGEMK